MFVPPREKPLTKNRTLVQHVLPPGNEVNCVQLFITWYQSVRLDNASYLLALAPKGAMELSGFSTTRGKVPRQTDKRSPIHLKIVSIPRQEPGD